MGGPSEVASGDGSVDAVSDADGVGSGSPDGVHPTRAMLNAATPAHTDIRDAAICPPPLDMARVYRRQDSSPGAVARSLPGRRLGA